VQQNQRPKQLRKCKNTNSKHENLILEFLNVGPSYSKKTPVKPTAQPVGFDLEIEKRIQELESKKKSEDGHFEFHSRPCPTKILEDVVGVPEKKVLPITVPKSPAFALNKKVQMFTREEEEEDEPVVIQFQVYVSAQWNFYFSLSPPFF
jgi:targeting protein for Xklp2